MAGTARRLSKRVRTSPGCVPLLTMYQGIESAAHSRWADVERAFLTAMWEFDTLFTAGIADQGDNQNGKGDFLTDVLTLLLEEASGRVLQGRGEVPGLFFPKHYLDAAYPAKGVVELAIETKAAGAPKNPRNPRQKNPAGRRGSADLKKRITEAGLKAIDLKAEYARIAGRGQGPAGDLQTWLRKSKPLCFLFLAVRVVDNPDHAQAIQFASTAAQMMDGTGLLVYGPDEAVAGYRVLTVPPELQMDRVLSRVATALRECSA